MRLHLDDPFLPPCVRLAFGAEQASALVLKVRDPKVEGVAPGFLPEPVVLYITQGMLLGTQFLHAEGVLHRDIKGQNVLLVRSHVFCHMARSLLCRMHVLYLMQRIPGAADTSRVPFAAIECRHGTAVRKCIHTS